MENVELKRVSPDKIRELQEISRHTFYETFSAVNTEENMNTYLQDNLSFERLTDELNNEGSEFYFALFQDKIIGYLKLNLGQAQNEQKNDNALEIERIYVLKEYHGKDIGKILFDTAMNRAKESDVDYVWLGVWEENARAIRFYEKNGFVLFDKHVFMLGDDKQTDWMMRLDLK